MRRGPAGRGTHPRADPGGDRRVGRVADDRGPGDALAREGVRVLTVAVRRLVEVHEVEVDGVPRQLDVRLRVQVQQRLGQGVQAGDPHLRGAERVHPRDDAEHVVAAVGLEHRAADGGGVLEDGLPDDVRRDRVGGVEQARDLLRLLGYLAQGLLAVEVLAAGEEPDLAVGVRLAHRGAAPWVRLVGQIASVRGVREAPPWP